MTIADWLIPRSYLTLVSGLKHRFNKIEENIQAELSKNGQYKQLHRGKRCFILGTGPSIGREDLSSLAKEQCISVNSFYLHKDYAKIKPQYHVISGIALHEHIPTDIGLEWFKEIEHKTDKAELFLNYNDWEIIQKKRLFLKRKVSYLLFTNDWDKLEDYGIDAAKSLYPSQSVSVMGLQLALYMGFGRIYLLGMDHDWILRFATKGYNHFYHPRESVLEKKGMTDWPYSDLGGEFYSHWLLWTQYKRLNTFAKRNKQAIYNATEGGLLDVFPRVDYKSITSPTT